MIAVLRKVDPHKADILSRPRSEMETHIRELAAGRIGPAEKPKPPKKPTTQKARTGSSVRNGGVYERSRL